MLEKFLKILKNLFIKFKKSFINILNAICLLFLFYNAIDMTFDYMSFSYSYKLIVDDNKESFDLPDISVCTENKILFAKNKIKHYFNIEYDVKMYGIEVKNFVESETYHERDTCTKDEDEFIDEFEGRKLKWRLNFCFNLYYRKYQRFVFNEMSFYEMNSLTFEANELFDCSANIPIEQNPIDLNVTQLDNCFDRFRVTKSIYANKELGICYTFFVDKNHIINITIKFEYQINFLMFNRDLNVNDIEIVNVRQFIWYIMNKDRDSNNKETAIQLKRVGFDARISVEITSIELLSTPYMDFCVNNGKDSLNCGGGVHRTRCGFLDERGVLTPLLIGHA